MTNGVWMAVNGGVFLARHDRLGRRGGKADTIQHPVSVKSLKLDSPKRAILQGGASDKP